MSAFSARYPAAGSPAPRPGIPPVPFSSNGPVFSAGLPSGPRQTGAVTPVINTFSSSASGTPLVNNFGAPSPATAFGTSSLLASQQGPRPPFSGVTPATQTVSSTAGMQAFSAATAPQTPQPPFLANGQLGTPAGAGPPEGMWNRPGGMLRPRYPSVSQLNQQPPGQVPPPPQAGPQNYGAGPSMPPPLNGLPPTNGPAMPGGLPPPPLQNGPMPPPPLQNGQMPPPPLQNGQMPPLPPSNGPLATGQNRFGGDMQSLGASLGGLSVTQSGKILF